MRPSAGGPAAWAAALALAAASCQTNKANPPAPQPPAPVEHVPRRDIKPSEFFRLRGQVLDGATNQPLPQARLSLRVVVPTPGGPRYARVYGLANPDGTYQLELPLPFDMVRRARAIELAAGMPGYEPQTVLVPPPTAPEAVAVAPTVALQRRTASPFTAPPRAPSPTAPAPPAPAEPADTSPLPWK
jgi:hypothetical protein